MRIAYLADHAEVIPELAAWFYQEWSHLYPDKTINDVRKAIGERTNRDAIPVALVAFEGTALAGTICLKTHDMDNRLDLSPWLAGLYIAESWRKKGVGTALVKAIEQKAEALGIRKLYLYTPSAATFYSRLAWRVKEATEYHGVRVTIMEKEMTLNNACTRSPKQPAPGDARVGLLSGQSLCQSAHRVVVRDDLPYD